MPPFEPPAIGRYVLGPRLGSGGMGDVYRAEDTLLQRPVALKVLRTGDALSGAPDSPQAAARLLREARAAAALDHPNAAAIYDVGEVNGHPYLAMELVVGQSLRALIGDAAQPLPQRIRWLTEVASALAAAHRRGIVHRDIKPENVMVRDDGVVKVLDFGIARRSAAVPRGDGAAPHLPTLTADGLTIGTPLYMAPEQLRGEPLDARADQFAWGVLAYEVLTGALPWRTDGVGAPQVVAQILTAEIAPLRDRAPEVRPAIESVVLRALARDPADRWPSMDDVVAALEPEGRTVTPPKPKERARSGRRRESVAFAALAACIAVVAAWRMSRRHSAAVPVEASTGELAASSLASSNPAALAAYRAGVQAFRDASRDAARANFAKAAELDPTFAVAHLRYIQAAFDLDETCREHLRLARQWRGRLGAEDQRLLDAIGPLLLVPAHLDEAEAKLTEMIRAYPRSVNALGQLARTRMLRTRFDAALEPLAAILSIDPGMTDAHRVTGVVQSYLGHSTEAIGAFRKCMDLSPSAISCIQNLNELQRAEGQCEDAESTSRRLINLDPDRPDWYELLATSLFAQGRSSEAVEQCFVQGRQRFADSMEGDRWSSRQKSHLEVVRGHLAEAERIAQDIETRVPADDDQEEHVRPAREQLDLLLEMGRTVAAGRRAASFLRSYAGWTPAPFQFNPTIYAWIARYSSGAMAAADFSVKRDAWFASENARLENGRNASSLWITGYALGARTRGDAELAMRALDRHGPIPPPNARDIEDDLAIGTVFTRAGRTEEALPFLRRASASCDQLLFPLAHTRALATYAEALAALGRRADACATMERFMQRWGAATPRSITAERVRRLASSCP